MFAQKASKRCIVLFIFRELDWESCGKEGEWEGLGGWIGVFLWGRWLYEYNKMNVTQKVALIKFVLKRTTVYSIAIHCENTNLLL